MKGILHNSSYPRDFIDKCIKKFLDKVLTQKVVVSTVPRKDLMIVLPYLGKLSVLKCGDCNATYYGKTKCHFKTRMCEHLGISALTGKRVKGVNDSAVKEHHLFCNHSSGFDDFSILASNNNDFKVTLMESLLINRDHPPLNKNRHSLSLELFDD